jgi:hypothetical protein
MKMKMEGITGSLVWRCLMAGVGLLARQPAEALTLKNNNKG